ncbi:MAG: glycosyltransferase family 2 protein [Chloroflexi bacterium]|uniref:glycosyltransferase family 2 protein n=1 Tax=Candidatus Flexifilum breve TaxID=3140694 RepID=UPI003136C304|nr:glycosyltransferase family 2 protein [Chloroflexota bacterium]
MVQTKLPQGQTLSPHHLLASQGLPNNQTPFFSIAIPHYKHRRYLEVVLASIFSQQFDDFEIVISNDCSPDDSDETLPPLLAASGRAFLYFSQPKNLGYDGNVRFCLKASRGRYVFLLGNDDCLGAPDTLKKLHDSLQELGYPKVSVTNYADWETSAVVQRARVTQILGSGVEAAVTHFRTFSFVSGLLYDREAAATHDTGRWDQSIYYQIYLACRIIAAGGNLGTLAVMAVRKDVQIDGERVPNYASKWSDAPWSFQQRHTGLDSVARVTIDAILPYVPLSQQSGIKRKVLAELLFTLHPFWVFDYRRVANWSFAVGVARGHTPSELGKGIELDLPDKLYLWALFLTLTPIALLIPVNLFSRLMSTIRVLVWRAKQGR